MALSTGNHTFQPMNSASSYHHSVNNINNVTSFDRQFLHWSFIVLEVAAIVTIVVGDISMLMLFFTRKLLGQSTNILVFSVAIGDLVNGALTFPLAMLQKILYEPSEFMCKGYFYFANVSKTAVAFTILLLAMERIAAVLNCTYRILPPGRCLFFASLTWFFAAAYNIWSVVIYDMETVQIHTHVLDQSFVDSFSICFASTRFMYLHEIFEYLNPLVTFAFPVVSSSLLFVGFWLKRREGDKPGRPYKSSKSVVIFTFALLVSFLATQIPWELANLVFIHDARYHTIRELVVLKVLHIFTFSRGFWDIFIFGAFRRYVCKKEKALAHFREQRSLQVQRSSLSIPVQAEHQQSLSLLDSDPSVSRRYSSDITISRRPSAMDGLSECGDELHPINNTKNGDQGIQLTEFPQRRKSTTITTTIISDNYLIPRSPCLHEHSRKFSFAPPCFAPDFPKTVDDFGIPKTRKASNDNCLSGVNYSSPSSNNIETHEIVITSAASSNETLAGPTDNNHSETLFVQLSSSSSLLPLSPSQSSTLVTSVFPCSTTATLHSKSKTISSPTSLLPSSSSSLLPSSSTSLLPSSSSLAVALSDSSAPMTSTLHPNSKHSLSQSDNSNSLDTLRVVNRKKKKSCSFNDNSIPHAEICTRVTSDSIDHKNTNSGILVGREEKVYVGNSPRSKKKMSLFLETTFDLTATSPTTTAVTLDNPESIIKLCGNDL